MRIWPQRPNDDYATETVVAYDIETIIDEPSEDGSFPPWPLHRPCAAAFLTALCHEDGRYRFELDTPICRPDEEAAFFAEVDRLIPKSGVGVGYNTHGFDHAVLRLQAMAAGCFALPRLGRQVHAGRFGAEHCDLADVFAARGATRKVSLAALCAPLGIPVKTSVSGADVQALWHAGEVEMVRRYVAEDSVATYILWLHYVAFRAGDEKLIALPLADLAHWIEATPDLAYLAPFATCHPALWARARAPVMRIAAAHEEATQRLERERTDAAFVRHAAF